MPRLRSSSAAAAASPSSPTGAADAPDEDAELDQTVVLLTDLPDAVRRCRQAEVIRKLAELMPGLRNAIKADKGVEDDAKKASIKLNGDVPLPTKTDARRASPPVRGAHSGLEPPTALQWLMQCITGEFASQSDPHVSHT